MVDLTGFLSLGNLFTAHITGNLVVVGALVVRRGQINPAQILAIPVFILAVAATWLFARASGRRGPGLRRLLLLVQFLLLIGFFGGCVVGAVAVSWLGDWAWSFPVALAGVAVML